MLTQERLESFDEASTAELARRLDEDDYPLLSTAFRIGICFARWPSTGPN